MKERHKLTRKYFMSLKEGLYLVGNSFNNSMQPNFAEKVAPLKFREGQWDRFKKINADQRCCNVYKSKKEYTKQEARFNNMEASHKLTRKYFMSLTEGLYLVSTFIHNPTPSYFAEKVAPLNLREDQWDRIKKVNADQRYCNVYKSKKECTRWVIQYNKNINEIKKQSMI